MDLTFDDLKEKPLNDYGQPDEKQSVKMVRKNFEEKRRWQYLSDLKKWVGGSTPQRANDYQTHQ